MAQNRGKGLVEYVDSNDSNNHEDNDDVCEENVSPLSNDGEDECEVFSHGDDELNVENAQQHESIGDLDFTGLTYEQIFSREFHTLEEAEVFYIEFSRQVGFAIRRHSFKKYVNVQPWLRSWCCQKQGLRMKKAKGVDNVPVTKSKMRRDFRENCPALFQVSYQRTKGLWLVTRYVAEHSHMLVPPEHVNFLTTHRDITDCDKAQIEGLRLVDLHTKDIRNVLVTQAGGHGNVGFQEKDLYNHQYCSRGLNEPDGDIQGVLCFFNAKKGGDLGFYYDNTVAKGNCMGNLFWVDSMSRFDYMCFGDVIAFDSAFKRNHYNCPLVVVIGINHHHETIIFACGVLINETAENYSWLLNKFLQCMGGKRPCVVVTDGDLSMRRAIRNVLPQTTHSLCSSHVLRNASSHVKDANFVSDFSKLMFARTDAKQFEADWGGMVEKYQLTDSVWMREMWESREMWAETYLKDKFSGVHAPLQGARACIRRLIN